MPRSSFYNSPTLYYSSPYDSNFKYVQLNSEAFRGEIDFSIPNLLNEQMREILGLNINKNTKETKKMEAKKCDRCGKLYEKDYSCDDVSMKVRFKHAFIACKEDMSEQRIIDKQTEKVAIHYDGYGNNGNNRIDLCPDCCKSFKRWFENG